MIPTDEQLKRILQEETQRAFHGRLDTGSLAVIPVTVLWKALDRIQQEFGQEAAQDFTRRMLIGVERQRAEDQNVQAELAVRRRQREDTKEMRRACWDAEDAFYWLLEPCPVVDEDAIDLEGEAEGADCPVKRVPLLEARKEIEAIRTAHDDWQASGTTQVEASWMFDRFSALGLDWRWVLMREFLLRTEFIEGISSPR